jgi:hypothetical protein
VENTRGGERILVEGRFLKKKVKNLESFERKWRKKRVVKYREKEKGR